MKAEEHPMSELKPCPFCGGTRLIERSENAGHGMSVTRIACLDCEASGGSDYNGRKVMLAAWNRRAPTAEAQLVAEAMRESAAAAGAAIVRAHTAVADRQGQISPILASVHQIKAAAVGELVAAIRALPLPPNAWRATHRHRKGGFYRVLCRAEIEANLTPAVVYDDAEGRTWVRPASEFDDGRFTPVPIVPAAPAQ